MSMSMSFHNNTENNDWNQWNFDSVHNDLCKINSTSCSKEMSEDVNDICAWHRMRMAKHVRLECDCSTWDACDGDAVGRWVFRDYYGCWDIPLIDSIGKFYCCCSCQAGDLETHQCGDMLVGECCKEKHSACFKLNLLKSSDDDWL